MSKRKDGSQNRTQNLQTIRQMCQPRNHLRDLKLIRSRMKKKFLVPPIVLFSHICSSFTAKTKGLTNESYGRSHPHPSLLISSPHCTAIENLHEFLLSYLVCWMLKISLFLSHGRFQTGSTGCHLFICCWWRAKFFSSRLCSQTNIKRQRFRRLFPFRAAAIFFLRTTNCNKLLNYLKHFLCWMFLPAIPLLQGPVQLNLTD